MSGEAPLTKTPALPLNNLFILIIEKYQVYEEIPMATEHLLVVEDEEDILEFLPITHRCHPANLHQSR
jgi:hypothetical protein